MTKEQFYKSKRWQRVRLWILRRDEYECQISKRYGKAAEAEHVHHIIPLEWCLIHDMALAYDKRNLISLSKRRHDEMHDRTNSELTEAGKALAVKTFGKDFCQKIFAA